MPLLIPFPALPLLILLVHQPSSSIHAEVFTLNDRNYPHIFINDPVTVPVVWHKKGFGFRLANSAAVRINARGIRFIPGSHELVLLDDWHRNQERAASRAAGDSSNAADVWVREAARLWWNDSFTDTEIREQEDALDAGKWRSILCIPSRESLCILQSSSLSSSTRVRSRFLPIYPQPVYLSQRDSSLLPMDVARMMGSGGRCPESATGRTAIAPQHASDLQQHDISLCNIVGMGSDYVYIPYRSRLFVLSNPVGNGSLVLMSIFIVYLMIVMGHNLQTVLGVSSSGSTRQSKSEKGEAKWAVVCMVGLLLLSCFSTGSNVMGSFITVQDRMAFIATVTYIAYYCIRVELNVYFGDGTRSNPVNPMLASISAAVQRVYGSAENPYSLILSFIMLTWALHKMSILGRRTLFAKDYFSSMSSSSSHSNSREQQPWYMQIRWWRGVDILADCILLSIMLYAGVMGQMEVEPSISAVQVLQGILAAMALNRALIAVHFSNMEKK